MDIKELKESGLIFYETLVGSRAYGTYNENSDADKKGFFWVDPSDYVSLNPPVTPQTGQISDDKNDNTFYSLYRAFELLRDANPNIIELLWMPKDCSIAANQAIMTPLFENRNLFISKQAYHSHAGYARNQIKKAKGANKKVHNPCPEAMPVKEDFCRVILINDMYNWFEADPHENATLIKEGRYPIRPNPIRDTKIDLSKHHVASLEHVPDAFRLYDYGDEAKGVFRGDDMLVCESIPKEDEWSKIVGILLYNKNEYDKAVKDWHSYWDFMKNRNINRWTSQIEGKIDYDCKNMQHCFRLLYEGLNIATIGEPVVRFEGERLQFLKDIRNEKFTYDELMERLAVLEERMDDAFKKCSLPESSDPNKLNDLYRHLMEVGTKYYDEN